MKNPRPDKAAKVVEVRDRLSGCDAALLTEYRGLDVPTMAELRRALRAAGGEYKIYKNTLVRLATAELGLDLGDLLTGPTAIAFVSPAEDGTPADAAAVAKVLRDFAKTNQSLVVKGGVLDSDILAAPDVIALADLPSREVLLAQLAGALAAPMTRMAGLMEALPRNFAYALSALVDQRGGADATEGDATEADANAADADATEADHAADADAAADDAEANDEQPAEA